MRSTAVFALLLGIFAAFAAAWSKEGTLLLFMFMFNWSLLPPALYNSPTGARHTTHPHESLGV
jgi:hypothetical protein